MKAWLSRKGVPFVERNVDSDERAFDELVALGWRTVPLTVGGGMAVAGFDEARLKELVRRVAEPQ